MPAIAPPRAPYPQFPAAQPTSEPTPIEAAAVEISRPPAPAGENVGRGDGSMRREHTRRLARACDSRNPLAMGVFAVIRYGLGWVGGTCRARPRERHRRPVDLEGAAAARAPLRARRARAARFPAQPARGV